MGNNIDTAESVVEGLLKKVDWQRTMLEDRDEQLTRMHNRNMHIEEKNDTLERYMYLLLKEKFEGK